MPADVAPLVADGGNIRLVRRVAAYAYGSREVTWPEGAEDPQGELPDGREFGWVAQLAGPRPGLSGRRFVRADAVIDAVEGVSNTEQLLDDAAERAGGDVHFETLISGRGLAGQVPGVDFALGDRVPARFWGRVLPGQLVTEVGWEEDGPYVKLGGQMLRDLDALARARAELTRTIRKEREETAGAVESVRSYADSAVSRERTERQEDVAQVREVLGGTRADETVLVSQLSAVQAQIRGMVGDGETPPPAGLLNAYLWMNTRLWQQQREIDAAQDLVAEQQTVRQDEQAAIVDTLQEQLGGLSAGAWRVGTGGDGLWQVSGSTVTAVGDWVGSAVLDVTYRREARISTETSYEYVDTYPREVRRVEVGLNRSWGFGGSISGAVLHYQRATGGVVRSNEDLRGFTASTSWQTVRAVTIRDKHLVSAELRVNWGAADRGSFYGVRITVDGQVVGETSSTTLGPWFPSGDGRRSQSLSKSFNVNAGQTVRFEVRSGGSSASQRAVVDGATRLWWVEN